MALDRISQSPYLPEDDSMRSTLRLATLILTVVVVADSTSGEVVINMPPPRADARTLTASGQQVDIGRLALARYSRARTGPRDTYLSLPYPDNRNYHRDYYYGFWSFPFGTRHLHFGFRGFGCW